mmetsp:Transcript_69582/g.166914  ORF Transcript_69582/g.166914 Transcript_69582/m.166914 type:complete len:223 (-) Transcript_69582:57-725(-)
MIWQAYKRQLAQRPCVVKALTSCCTFTLTDLLAQRRDIQKKDVKRYDLTRTARNGLFGLLWLGPLNHVVWGRTVFGLEYWFPGSSWRAVMSRVVVDQLTNMPLNMVMFLAWPALLTGQGLAAAAQKVREAFIPSVTFAWSIWPFVHPFNFRYVPLEHRLLVLNICSLVVFSYATAKAEQQSLLEETSASSSSKGLADAPGSFSSRDHSPLAIVAALGSSPVA